MPQPESPDGKKSTVKIQSIKACRGPVTGGTQITLTGKDFLPKNEVKIGGVRASCTYKSPTEITCTMPAHKAGKAAVSISNDNGTDRYANCEYTNVILPDTGFAQGQASVLPKQPAKSAYHRTGLQLVIPSLKVNTNIVGVPAGEQTWDVTWLGNQAGYLAGSAFPTWTGNSVLTGHVWNADNTPGIFAGLNKMKYGERFMVKAFGNTYTYEVRENLEVKPWDANAMLKHNEDKSWITSGDLRGLQRGEQELCQPAPGTRGAVERGVR